MRERETKACKKEFSAREKTSFRTPDAGEYVMHRPTWNISDQPEQVSESSFFGNSIS